MSAITVLQALAAMLCLVASGATEAQATVEFERADTIEMPGAKGRIDHLAADVKGRRIFVAALGSDTMEVVDLDRGRAVSVRGFSQPQGVAYLPRLGRLVVTNGGGDRVDILDAASLGARKRIESLDDADNVRLDSVTGQVLVGYGKGEIAVVDVGEGRVTGSIPLPGHPEAFEVEQRGPRVFVNVPSARKVVVVDRAKKAIVAEWELPGARANYSMALDEAGRRLFVGTRSPPTLVVYDIDSGWVADRLQIGADVDDLFFDRSAGGSTRFAGKAAST